MSTGARIRIGDPPGEWVERRACHLEQQHLFFPEGDKTSKTPPEAQACAICRGCPVSFECDRYATVNAERWGVWGGINRHAKAAVRDVQRRQMEAVWREQGHPTATSQPAITAAPLPMPQRRTTLPRAQRGRQPQHGNESCWRRGCRCDTCIAWHDNHIAAKRQRQHAQRDELAALRAEQARREQQRRTAAGEAWA